ncbi:AAA family ATPase [Actinophytocola gossypii]|uniref:AAA family ATPase n=1 Tax=Actinophytocola gossypii TaxID=2812003 RepID=A0ABT2JAV3_9PSEU|nr:AAA family ATPase [Actinophytocola gossypii]MCT2585000.1 AAA family ATPase [Actinophytocola gossypii]
MLVVVGGLPATGKTTVSRAVARKLGAAYLRIDTIEQAVVRFAERESSGDELRHAVTWGLGYDIAYAVARDLLSQGSPVIAECVNPMEITRDAWRDAAASTRLVEVELVCSDPAEHERRATSRTVDIPDLTLPTWADIVNREYEPWDRPHVVLDTAGKTPEDTVAELCAALGIDD